MAVPRSFVLCWVIDEPEVLSTKLRGAEIPGSSDRLATLVVVKRYRSGPFSHLSSADASTGIDINIWIRYSLGRRQIFRLALS